ncbi:MAG: ISNCY family transposase [Dysgonamonadaceae bacterium]|nr:ISNCY family transposase [Dysgonamonadaceae bacterium]
MKMKIFEDFRIKFEQADWSRNPEFGLLDTILEVHPELLKIVEPDIRKGEKPGSFGRKDMPSVEQIVRSAIYKELKGLDYRELEYHQVDSRICEQFVKIAPLRPFSFQVYQKYISKISAESLDELLVSLNRIAISEGLEDLQSFRQDSTVIETNIHYPANNALVWDCIKESHRLLTHLQEEIETLTIRDYTKSGKKTCYLINNTKSGDKRVNLFKKQLVTFTKSINQVSNVVKKKRNYKETAKSFLLKGDLKRLLVLMQQVYSMTLRREVKGEKVANDEKIFSIYELHTGIIVKGSREVQFGHKVNLSTGRSNLILSCEVLDGNPADSSLYKRTLDKVTGSYGITPRDSVTDGGYASTENLNYAQSSGVANVVFNKIVGSLRNRVSSKNMETRLKKWRSGMEAVISNYKRKFEMFRCTWKGKSHFKQKVLWSAIAYNIRVMTATLIVAFQ